MTLDELLNDLNGKINPSPKNYVSLFIHECYSAFLKFYQRATRFFKKELSLFNERPEGLWSIPQYLSDIFFLLLIVVIVSQLAQLIAFMGIANIIKSIFFIALATAVSYIANMTANFCYNVLWFTLSDKHEQLNKVYHELRDFNQEQSHKRTHAQSTLYALKTRGISRQSLSSTLMAVSELDFCQKDTLTSLKILPEIKQHFKKELHSFIAVNKEQNESLKNRLKKETTTTVLIALKNRDKPWSLTSHLFLIEPENFIAVEKMMKEYLSVTIDYKESLLYQMNVHNLYRYCTWNFGRTFLVKGQVASQSDKHDIGIIQNMLIALGCVGANPKQIVFYRRMLRRIFYAQPPLEDKCLFQSSYLDQKFLNQLERLCTPHLSLSKDSKVNRQFILSKSEVIKEIDLQASKELSAIELTNF